MTERFSDSQATREALSALADGQAQASEVTRACSAWRDDAQAKATWQAYHLIGDVMRSEDLAQGTDGSAFLSKFRDRLAQEPVVLAPASAQAAVRPSVEASSAVVALKRRAWAGPMAVAAGFVMVVGAVVSMQMGGQSGGAGNDPRQMAQAPASVRVAAAPVVTTDSGPIALASANTAALAGMPVQSGSVSVEGASFSRPDAAAPVLIRDPQVDQLLASLPRHGNSAEATFASQGNMARAAVFELP
ncbi:MAG: sigma-E factor negative regulatory protein [Burkholderiales bacterium]|nr:sigma-E factor negative regulatory protein [Burkholderiales bacterium]